MVCRKYIPGNEVLPLGVGGGDGDGVTKANLK